MFRYLSSEDDSTDSEPWRDASGVADEDTDSLIFIIKKGPSSSRVIKRVLSVMIRGLSVFDLIHYLWLLYGSRFLPE